MPSGLPEALHRFEESIDNNINSARKGNFAGTVIPDTDIIARLRANADELEAGTWVKGGGPG